MSQKILLDLAMKLSANSAELKRGIEESNRSLRSLNQNTRNIGRDVRNSFAQMAVAVAAAQQGFKMFESTLRASQKTNDYIDKQIAGITNGIGYLQTSVASMDFTNMQQGFLNAVAAGREFAEVMDEINDRARAVSWRSSDKDVDIAAARLTMNNEELSLQDRINAGLRAQQLLEQKLNDERGISEEKYTAIYNKIRDTYDVTDQQMGLVEAYLKNYDNLGEAGFRNVTEYLEKLKESQQFIAQMDRTDPMSFAKGLDLSQQVGGMFSSLTRDEKLMLDVVQNLSDKLSDELRDSLANAGKEVNASMIRTMNEMRSIQRRLSSLQNQKGSSDMPEVDTVRTQLTEQLGPIYEEWEQLQIGMAISMGDYNNVIVTLQSLQEEVSRLMQIRLTMSPDDEGYAAINQSISNLNEIISERLQLGLLTDPEPIAEFQERIEDLKQSFIDWQSIAVGATQGIASAFVDMAFGAKKSIDEIIREMMRFIAMQFITNMISGLFNPISTGANMLGGGGGFSPNLGAMLGGLNLQIPQMASGGLAYGPSIVQVGEYPGANLDPEIISKASDLRRILAVDSRSKNVAVTVKGMLDGEDLFISSARHIKRKNLTE